MLLSCLDCQGTHLLNGKQCPFCNEQGMVDEDARPVIRSASDIAAIELKFECVGVSRHFEFRLPDDFGYDHNDCDDIERSIFNMDPSPTEVQQPVASGLGDLVYDGFQVTFMNDKRSDKQILRLITEAVRRGLRQREWRKYKSGTILEVR